MLSHSWISDGETVTVTTSTEEEGVHSGNLFEVHNERLEQARHFYPKDQ